MIDICINTNGDWKNLRNSVETRRQQAGMFSPNFEFFQFPRVIQLYINTEKMFIFFKIQYEAKKYKIIYFNRRNTGHFLF